MNEYALSLDDCNHALELNTNYIKVIVRRFQIYEKMDKLDEALADAKRVQELDPSYPKISSIVCRLELSSQEKLNKMKDEALGTTTYSLKSKKYSFFIIAVMDFRKTKRIR